MAKGLFSFFASISNCGLNCKHCTTFNPNNKKVFKSVNEVKKVIEQLAELRNLEKYEEIEVFYYDDPFTHPEIEAIINETLNSGINLQLAPITNGVAIAKNKKLLSLLKSLKITDLIKSEPLDYPLQAIGFSLYGLEEYHDNFTGVKGSYKNVMEAVEICKKEGISFFFNLFLTNENMDNVIELFRRYGNLKFNILHFIKDVIRICIVCDSKKLNYSGITHNLRPTKDQLEKCIEAGIKESFFSNEFKTQSEWGKIVENSELFLKYYDYSVDSWFNEQNGILYLESYFFDNSDIIGNIYTDRLKELVENNVLSIKKYIWNAFYHEKHENIIALKNKWIDDSDNHVYIFDDLIFYIWFDKELKNNFDYYWYQLPVEKVKIKPMAKTIWNYMPKIEMFYISDNKEEMIIKKEWGYIINEMLKGKFFKEIIEEQFGEIDENQLNIYSQNLLKIAKRLYDKNLIYIVIYGS